MYAITLSFTVRLANGSSIFEGRLEVQHDDLWGTVCDYGWDIHDAQVICNQLGFGQATAAAHNALYGEGHGQIWLENVNCVGTELTIEDCSHNGWGYNYYYYYCTHGDDASVRCSSGTKCYICIAP